MNAPTVLPVVPTVGAGGAAVPDSPGRLTSNTCRHCGCVVHSSHTIAGRRYWASKSGSPLCPWPFPEIFHEVAR